MNDAVCNMIIDRIDRIENKVDKLLEFKWKISGVALFVGAICGLLARVI